MTALTLYHPISTFNDNENEAFENILGKGENAGSQLFLLIPKCFQPFSKQFQFLVIFILLSARPLNLDLSKFCRRVKGLKSST